MLTLKRASKSRPGVQWSNDDYDVLDGDRPIGRIMWTHAALGATLDLSWDTAQCRSQRKGLIRPPILLPNY
jgi:hypothetical protein